MKRVERKIGVECGCPTFVQRLAMEFSIGGENLVFSTRTA